MLKKKGKRLRGVRRQAIIAAAAVSVSRNVFWIRLKQNFKVDEVTVSTCTVFKNTRFGA